jgi:hypothetical protein
MDNVQQLVTTVNHIPRSQRQRKEHDSDGLTLPHKIFTEGHYNRTGHTGSRDSEKRSRELTRFFV